MSAARSRPSVDPELPDPDETMDLALRAKGGDEQALNELVARHQEWLVRVVRIKLRGTAARARRYFDTMDIVQESLGVVLGKIGDLDVRSAPGVRQWLAKIVTYQIKDCLKYRDAELRNPEREVQPGGPGPASTGVGSPLDVASDGTQPHERAWKAELKTILDDAIARLPEHYQEVVLLRDYAKEDWEGVRARIGKESVGAAKRLYQRAWIKIQEIAGPRLQGR